MKQKTGRKLLSFLLTLVMVVGLMPGMSMTAYADDTKVGSATYTINDGVLTVGSGSFTKEQWRAIFSTTNQSGTPTGPSDIAKTITKVVFENGAATSGTAGMFFGWTALKEADLSKLDTSGATDMWSMFKGCSKLETINLSGLKTTDVTDMESMFANCSSLKTLDLSSFNTQKCSNFSYMFNGCSQLTTITVGENWTTAKQKNWSQMFQNCTNLVGGNGTTYVANKGKEYAIIDGTDGNPGFLTGSSQVHTHSFSYTAEGAAITATCNATTGTCGLTDKTVTLTLKAPSINTYGMGQNEKAALEGAAAFNEATGKAISEENIEYYKGETKLDAAPKDAGTYTAKITVEEKTATVSYTIQKGNNITAVGKPQAESKTENSITLKSTEGYEYKCGDGGSWQTSNVFSNLAANTFYTFYQRIAETDNLKPSATSGGAEISTNSHIHVHDLEYTLSQDGRTITATCKKTDPGHEGDESAALTINVPKLLVVPETRDAGSTSMSIISPNYASELTGRQDFNEFTGLDIRPIQIKYYSVDGETETSLDNYPHEAGTYRAKITAGDKTASVDYTISKIDLTADKFTYTAPENLIYNGEAKTATVASKKEGVGEVTVEYWNAEGQKLDSAPVNAGTYTVKISVTESTRYNSVEHLAADGWTFTITKAAPTVTAPTAKTLTYNGSAQQLVNAGSATGGTMKYAVTTENTAPTDESLYTTSIPTGTDAGTYYVWYKVVGDANHNDTAAAMIEVTIKPTDTTPTAPSAGTLTYTGEAQALVTGGSVTGGELQYALGTDAENVPTESWGITVPTGTNAGIYYVWYRIVGDANHNDVDPTCIEVPIAKAPITPTVSITGWTYGEAANAPSVGGNTGSGNVSYAYSDAKDGTYSATVPSNAGTYFVRATVAETANYLGATTEPLSFAIAKANITLTADNKTGVYGEEIAELTHQISSGFVEGDELGVELSTTAQKGSDVGEYPITLKWNENPNYSATLNDGTYTVTKATATVTADAKSKVEGEADPALTYTVTGLIGSDKLTGALTRDAGEAPGTYAIKQGTLTAGDNYALTFKDAALTISGKPATPAEPSYLLLAKLSTSGKKALKVSWTKVPGAEGFDIYFAHCGQTLQQVGTVGGSATSYTVKGLNKYDAYKGYVVAWKTVNGAKVTIGESPLVHAITGGNTNKYTNPKKVTVKKSKVKLAVGKTAKIKASVAKTKNSRKLLNHESKLRYYSSNPAVATVSASGKITAVGAGSCKIYAVAVNGTRAAVKVTVK